MATYVALVKVFVEADNEEDAVDMFEDAISSIEDSDLGRNITFSVENDLTPVD